MITGRCTLRQLGLVHHLIILCSWIQWCSFLGCRSMNDRWTHVLYLTSSFFSLNSFCYCYSVYFPCLFLSYCGVIWFYLFLSWGYIMFTPLAFTTILTSADFTICSTPLFHLFRHPLLEPGTQLLLIPMIKTREVVDYTHLHFATNATHAALLVHCLLIPATMHTYASF